MTDNRTTEMRKAARSIQGNLGKCLYLGRCLYRRNDVDKMQKVSDLLFEAADTIESIGNGTLTAEQVEKAIHDCSTYASYDGCTYYASGIRLQAITDELNAELGSGTCELHDCDGSFSAVNRPVWRCDCGAFMTQYTDATTYHKPRFCPNCGARIRKAVE